jgi:hypothetical protein
LYERLGFQWRGSKVYRLRDSKVYRFAAGQ